MEKILINYLNKETDSSKEKEENKFRKILIILILLIRL